MPRADGGYLPAEVGVNPDIMKATDAKGVENFLDWLGDITPTTVDILACTQLSSSVKVCFDKK